MESMFIFGLEGASAFASISDAFSSGMTTMVADTMSMVSALVPIILPLFGAAVAVSYAIKYLKTILAK